MKTLTYSPLATKIEKGVRDPQLAIMRKPWGYMIHTTGSGVVERAYKKEFKTPLDAALDWYLKSQNGIVNSYKWGGPAYVIDYDGTLYQIAPDEALTHHAGSGNRPLYMTGTWIGKVTTQVADLWRKRWPGRKHPYSLFPSMSPNVDYIGAEMMPVGRGFGGAPMAPGLKFTKAQHDTAIALGKDLGERHGWPAGWANTNRLLGHEDVDPVERSDRFGGWDPGFLRTAPYFDFKYVREGIMK